jgi:hypothetical protein
MGLVSTTVRTGAILQNDQKGIILHFRSHQIGMVARQKGLPDWWI